LALQLPALKSIGEQIGVDFSSAVDVSPARPEKPQRPAEPAS
jgi:hypothetical protein